MSSYLRLLTYTHVVHDGQTLDVPPHKPFALLFHLALRGEWVSREELADLFRPEANEETARHYLRLLISQVRHLPYAQTLEITPKRLRWLVDSDVKTFREAVGRQELQKALALYERPLLISFPRTDFEAYESWLELERATLHKAWQRASLELAQKVPAKEAVPS